MAELTKTQAKRLAAHLQGDSLSTIADAEGCSKQAVAKSLAAPAVRDLVPIFGNTALVDADTGEPINLVAEALSVIAHVMNNAHRSVVITQRNGDSTQQHIEYVPDYPTRLAAASRILNLVDKPAPKIAVEQERETVTTHTRERVRVDAG